ncbi:MAG: ABC transporter ATP-binding protein [Desulfobacteraceae bacterium]|nr:MAG: ABC transporter ATP-binding protein [Desulfobacteraceae bacterium]
MAQYWKGILAVFALTILMAAMNAAEPLLMKSLFDALGFGRELNTLLMAVAGLVFLVLARCLIGGLLNWTFWRVRIGVNNNLQHAVVDCLCSLPLSFFRNRSVGGIITKMNRGIGGYMDAFGEFTSRVLPNLIYLVLSLGAMVMLDWRLFLLALGFCPLPTLIGVWAAKEQTVRENIIMNRWTRIFGHFHEVLAGIATVKSFTREKAERRQFMHGVYDTNRIVMRGVVRDTSVEAVNSLIVNCGRVAIAAYGGYLVIKGQATVGTVVAFLGYIGGLFGPMQGLTGSYQMFRRASVYLSAIFEFLDAANPLKDAPDAIALSSVRGQVRFENVAFGYKNDTPVLHDITLEVAAGETIALVGPSGAGKSTLLSLLQRFDDPSSGAVYIDGTDVRKIQRESLCHQIAFVLQDTMLFNDSLRNNIAYGRPEASMQEIIAAAKAANAHDFIQNLTQGYDTMAGEGGKCLSVGQRQRISIARALLKNAPILVLDEATSSLDAESELLVQQALRTLKAGRTTFVIAHRLQTIAAADRILVIKEGRIMEQGTHAELIRKDSYYARVVRKQAQGLRMPVDMAA